MDAILPNIGKVVRLTFHDCVNEKDTGAGCNGCLNFEGMGRFYWPVCAKRGTCNKIENGTRPLNGPFTTDNNNLLWVAQVLEAVYKDNSTGQSLYEAGKSRADLWAYAGLVAIQRSVERNNNACPPQGPFPCMDQVNAQSPRCDFELPEPSFRTGRSDCVPSCTGPDDYPFCTTNKEVHPSPTGNGTQTVQFFKDNFGFNPRQSAALMGVHTLGHPTEGNSMFRHYPWTRQGENKFNNMYYVNIVNATGYRYVNPVKILKAKGLEWKKCGNPISFYTGDEYGNPAPMGYRVRSEFRTAAFGPWSWSLHQKSCSVAICKELADAGTAYSMNSCCHWLDFCADQPEHCVLKKREICFEKEWKFQSIALVAVINTLLGYLSTTLLSPYKGIDKIVKKGQCLSNGFCQIQPVSGTK